MDKYAEKKAEKFFFLYLLIQCLQIMQQKAFFFIKDVDDLEFAQLLFISSTCNG